MTFTFTILGPPKTKKNSQRILRNRKTGRPFVAQSVQQKTWARAAVMQLRAQWHQLQIIRIGSVISAPVNMCAVVYRERATGDLLNYLAAVSDALEAAGVIANDRQVVSVDGSRMDKDAANPRVEVEVTVL